MSVHPVPSYGIEAKAPMRFGEGGPVVRFAKEDRPEECHGGAGAD